VPGSGEQVPGSCEWTVAAARVRWWRQPLDGLGGPVSGLTRLCPWVFLFCFLFDLMRRTFQLPR
jgi:hypothetical protein